MYITIKYEKYIFSEQCEFEKIKRKLFKNILVANLCDAQKMN